MSASGLQGHHRKKGANIAQRKLKLGTQPKKCDRNNCDTTDNQRTAVPLSLDL
jgi:hypothetical protein